MSEWSIAAPGSVVFAGLIALVAVGWLSWAQWNRRGRSRLVGVLEAGRFLLALLLVFTLFQPEFIRYAEESAEPEILVLTDASASMATKDIQTDNGVISRSEWAGQLTNSAALDDLRIQAKVTPLKFSSAGSSGEGVGGTNQVGHGATDLSEPLRQALEQRRNLKAVLLLSDGAWNTGPNPVGVATEYRRRQIPIFTVAMGAAEPLPDLELFNVSPPSFGLLGEQISIPFRVRNRLSRSVTTTAFLRAQREVLAQKEITIPPGAEIQESVVWRPDREGLLNMNITIPVQEGETFSDNNRDSFDLDVKIETLKVLLVDSLPRWEYRYLRNALNRDPGVELHTVLFHPQLGPGGGDGYLPAFPGAKELLGQYDVIFLGDAGVGGGELSVADAELIAGLIENQASGLVFLPGSRGRHLTFLDTPLNDLMPVQLDTAQPRGIGLQNESQLTLSSQGAAHFLPRFSPDPQQNAEIWRQLPGFYWSAAVEKSRPGAQVLAVHSNLRNAWGRMPLLVTRPYGSGNTLFMGTDSAWRWRRGVEDKYHYRFWSQVVRWMSHQRHLSAREGIRVVRSPENPTAGDTLYLQATILNQRGAPLDEGEVFGTLSAPSGRSERFPLTPESGGWGLYKGAVQIQEGGAHELIIEAPGADRRLPIQLLVDSPNLERLGDPVNDQTLREIAEISGGQMESYSQFEAILGQIAATPDPVPRHERIRLWSNPWWGGLILLLLTAYWTGRKLAGML